MTQAAKIGNAVLVLGSLLFVGCGEPRMGDALGAIEVSPPALELGTFLVGTSHLGEVRLRNSGKGRVSVGIGALPSWMKVVSAPTSLAPGEEGALVIRLHGDRQGTIEEEVRLSLGGAGGSDVRIPVRGQVAPFAVETVRMLSFGMVPRGERATTGLAMKNRTDLPLRIELEVEGSEAFSVEPWWVELGPREEGRVEVGFMPSMRNGSENAWLALRCQGCPRQRVQLSGLVGAPDLRITPAVVAFGSVAPWSSGSEVLTISNEGDADVRVEALGLVGDEREVFSLDPIGAPLALAPGESVTTVVRFEPRGAVGPMSATVELEGSYGELLRVPVAGWADSSTLVAHPASLDMGIASATAPKGQQIGGAGVAHGELEIERRGEGAPGRLEVELLGEGSEAFALEPLDGVVIDSGDSLRFAVAFAPQEARRYEVEAVFSLDHFTLSVPLVGRGAVPSPTCPTIEAGEPGVPLDLVGADESGLSDTTCRWTLVRRAPGSASEIEVGEGCSGRFVPDVVGGYLAEFEVMDGAGNRATCHAPIEVAPPPGLFIEAHWSNWSDVDLHLLHMGLEDPAETSSWGSAADCHFATCLPESRQWLEWTGEDEALPLLSQDDTAERGPETIHILSPSQDHGYALGIHWYRRGLNSTVDVSTRVYCRGDLIQAATHTLVEEKALLYLGAIEVEEATCAFKTTEYLFSD